MQHNQISAISITINDSRNSVNSNCGQLIFFRVIIAIRVPEEWSALASIRIAGSEPPCALHRLSWQAWQTLARASGISDMRKQGFIAEWVYRFEGLRVSVFAPGFWAGLRIYRYRSNDPSEACFLHKGLPCFGNSSLGLRQQSRPERGEPVCRTTQTLEEHPGFVPTGFHQFAYIPGKLNSGHVLNPKT